MRVTLPCLLLLCLGGCGNADTTAPPQGMGELMSGSTEGYARVRPDTVLAFPRDHGAHEDFRQEWWYFTANLTLEDGTPLGLQWTQFRVAVAPPTVTGTGGDQSGWRSRQLWFAHAAVTSKDNHSTAERWSRGHARLASAGGEPFAVFLDNWRWQADGDEILPATLNVDSRELSYRLRLTRQGERQLQGEQGFSRKSDTPGLASFYYSQPFIAVAGEVRLQDGWHAVSGQGWLDREWSSAFLGPGQQGWDWFALHLGDGSALMLFQLRQQGRQPFSSARRSWPDGRSEDLRVQSLQPTSLVDGYPVGWSLSLTGAAPLSLQLKALNSRARMALSIDYWEGPVWVSGDLDGVGYLELTGY